MLKEIEQQIIDSLTDLEVEDSIPEYQVQLHYLDADEELLARLTLKSYDNPEDAVAFAEEYTELVRSAADVPNKQIPKYGIVVETIIDYEGQRETIATLYKAIVEIK